MYNNVSTGFPYQNVTTLMGEISICDNVDSRKKLLFHLGTSVGN